MANAIKEIILGIKRNAQAPAISRTTSISSALKRFFYGHRSALPFPKISGTLWLRITAPTVYLAWTSFELKSKREEMSIVLQKAGFNVVPGIDCPSDENAFKQKTNDALVKSAMLPPYPGK